MKNAPCARFGIRIRPKMSEKPDDNRNSRPPKATLFSVWMIQNCHCIFQLLLGERIPDSPMLSLPGLTLQVGLARLASVKTAEFGQARVPAQSILLRKDGPPGQAPGVTGCGAEESKATARDSLPAGNRANRPGSSGTRPAYRSRTG